MSFQAMGDEGEMELHEINMGGSSNHIENFFSEVDAVWEGINKIQASVEEVQKIHSAILSAPQTDESKSMFQPPNG